VFDVSQTDGEELPTIREIGGDVGENRERLFVFVEKQGIELSFSESIAPALGMSYGGRIALLPGQSTAEEFSTLVHELLHRTERRTATTKVMRETEAEAVAFIVGKAVGLDTGSAGARRFRAAQLAGFEEIPVRVVQLSDAQALEWMLVELSIAGKSFRCLHAVLHVVYM